MFNMKEIEADFTLDFTPGNIKAAMKDQADGSADLWKVKVENVHVIPGFNPRLHDENREARIRWIADSIKENGYYPHEPMGGIVALVDGKQVVFIYSGHTRLAGVHLANSEGAGIEVVPVSVQRGLSMDDLNIKLINGNEGQPLSPYETAIVVKRLINNGVSEEEVCRRTRMSPGWLGDLLLLMSSSTKLRELVARSLVSPTFAIEALKEHGSEAYAKLKEALDKKSAGGEPKRITKKDVAPVSKFVKLVRKSAPTLFTALEEVKSDPGFKSLSPELQSKLLELVEGIGSTKEGVNEPDNTDQLSLIDSKNEPAA